MLQWENVKWCLLWPVAIPGGGRSRIWFGRGCAADAAKPISVFRGIFGRKYYPVFFYNKFRDTGPVFRN